ncbi:MAG: DNA/RNA helicase, superfamily II [Candidatus Nomurabacteria bacterium GW2011_GWF2_35_66]|uniref:DNA/RNA helicase, superfamily II n=1 Tax=Candidatus Nomurabacteria bacterium GW2011_GWE1_35_16 TaxID=1618761 RepID=A0A0G0DRF7_9BACT|nr:MAG: DNA/RNA helicase, superfamily II [Candidatus Nomurabacteria bacterium GW2011_GWF1_34_20]KKP63422.1 MAG: DNA/RNA helicase, superfamily II [Candidatus Nomurabacteria bacterium GW2011_GWE2_34_25]KKP65610.1 MAG: DNA/RNA helicase, superfamily II [Candidatus Nomurabacteria bacterium GW2011_GWE1_35_16]KKP83660.1 MAG: DNA/RNA helicase, superfamily II [Candidatus Nomurabacteria bacterium GW2011_GWF2_35_66]HAE36918.1 ATP-dependent helicase [Candidatus Nomurabacteria bacterium]
MYTSAKQRGSSRAPNYSSGGRTSNGSGRSSGNSRGGSSFGSRSASRSTGRPSFGGNRGGGGRNKRKSSYERIDVSRFISKSTVVEKEEIYLPTHTFGDFKIDTKLKLAIANKNYIYPSPIQDKSIPHALDGRDILGIADTGTGKTAAFLIPILNKILKDKNETAIIIAPTRELATQIEVEFNDFAQGMRIFSVVCVGGMPITAQIRNLRRECNVVIGTPGRLLDLVKRGEINLSSTRSVVLDEADRMLDMGFINDITFLLEKTPEDRQGFFFSATLPKPIEKLIERFATDPVKVMVKTRETSKNVEQDVIRLARGEDKIDALCDLLSKEKEFKKVLIFSEMKHSVEKLSNELVKRGYKSGSIHGDKRQNDRQRTLTKFRNNELNILVATDVAARGLDIPEVTHVINYEIPQTYDTYIHRIGRTGRASKKGVALTFVG